MIEMPSTLCELLRNGEQNITQNRSLGHIRPSPKLFQIYLIVLGLNELFSKNTFAADKEHI